jgi:hypothetical protein
MSSVENSIGSSLSVFERMFSISQTPSDAVLFRALQYRYMRTKWVIIQDADICASCQ